MALVAMAAAPYAAWAQVSPSAAQALQQLTQIGGTGPVQSRPTGALAALFEQGTVNGTELIAELATIRALMKVQRSAGAAGAVLGVPEGGGGSGGFDPRAKLLEVALRTAEESARPYIASIGFGALDMHLRTLIEDPQLLSQESIKLPSARGLSHAQMQRVANMAAIVVATRVTGKILKKAQEDFADVEADYNRLIERREATAKLLFDLLSRGAAAQGDIAGLYSDDDLKYLRDNVAKMPVQQFANDLGAQNLALRWLRKSDPSAWEEYRSGADGLRKSTKGYIRATAGVTAFSALLATFFQETVGNIRRNRGADILGALPFAWEFIKEVPPLLKVSWQVGAAGIVELPMKSLKRFRVIDAKGAESMHGSAAEVLKVLGDARALLDEALFRNGNDGLLYKLYRCDKSEVGRMLDAAVPLGEREKFAADYRIEDAARFSFANAFNAPAERRLEHELGDELLRRDQRERGSVQALGEVQRLATRGVERVNSDQFLRLILANREATAALASLQLGEVTIRPVPSMQSVYAYETLVDECARQFAPAPAAMAPAAPPAPSAVKGGTTKKTPSPPPAPKNK
jgi:hypothetical protein